MQKFELRYYHKKYRERFTPPAKTLQLFITTMCNKRCRACFYAHQLGHEHMSFDMYSRFVLDYHDLEGIEKIILLGGEPTLHPELKKMIEFNQLFGLKTTVYTNGCNLDVFKDLSLEGVNIRIGVYGSTTSEKALSDVKRTTLPVTIVFMARKDNVHELPLVAKMAEEDFNCQDFYISSIRDIAQTGSYWIDNEETISMLEYFNLVQHFVVTYGGNMNLHISRRGIIRTKMTDTLQIGECRFANIFPDGKLIVCPFDISLEKYSPTSNYGRKCNKDSQCILQKVVLEQI